MRELKPSDPLWVGGHRLLRRLGAGGMGVVYLARSPGGALVALKLIRTEYADEPGFRIRFRREAELAASLRGRWLVPVTAADPQAPEPWLATAYVPAPSLAEALAAHGPLPPHTVRILGARLAEALAEVHAAGLVHRDVKPGNVLLALDGPRLIDFGIARPVGAVPLTASGVVVGSPGYLSPEQAQARTAETGPPSDIFSLGCVLAHAATGRRPFGGGAAAAVLYRTVHEEADLDGAPGALLPLLRGCLAKDPGDRPTAGRVRELTAGPGLSPDPREVPGSGSRATEEGGWLPPALPRLIAERSAQALDVPVPDPTRADGAPAEGEPSAPGGRPSRRRLLGLLVPAAGAAALGGAALWARAAGGGGRGGADGPLPQYTIGLHADLSGGNGPDGAAQEHGVRLALREHRARPDRSFDLLLEVRDDAGDPALAARTAEYFAQRPEVVAVIGPTADAVAEEALAVYDGALLPVASVSVATTRVSSTRYPGFFRLRQYESSYAVAVISYLTERERSTRTAIVEDRAAAPGIRRLAASLTQVPPAEGTATSHPVEAGSEDFGAVVEVALATEPEGLVFVGDSPHRAAACARALHEAGFTGPRVTLEPVMTDAFFAEAGEAAEGWAFTATHVDPAAHPEAGEFVTAYREHFGVREVPRHAAEAYDALQFLTHGLEGLAESPAGTPQLRDALRSRLWRITHEGITKTIRWHQRSLHLDHGLFHYRAENGRPRFLGPHRS
ncbi:bifunctional serine/threonine-protein kinase/ABC transporter substrate-binding protein [Streptomyces sp. ACA25]|uniref:bifunctional serine/threonine-protein kinase/ABC transporter substrate-binding protein n=1 Tax=Streptomyces sp. ACA25 TaxID=3022596 RepID=UPI002307116F|nr:bifunctional serine/threonine-protein kinase/ABC transporter substrate-binding protein [Streptomyces sp. ACA25]MDB1086578.1 bifunctional serine/threonine-protein kinase/ABC transporter substrate-binding protein [Streptomyces sp. ACA25]